MPGTSVPQTGTRPVQTTPFADRPAYFITCSLKPEMWVMNCVRRPNGSQDLSSEMFDPDVLPSRA